MMITMTATIRWHRVDGDDDNDDNDDVNGHDMMVMMSYGYDER